MKMNLSTTAQIAWRNVWKNRRRTILTMLSIIIGCTVILFQRSIQNGGYRQVIDDNLSPNVGHIQIHCKGYWEFQSIDYSFLPNAALLAQIDRLKKNGDLIGYTNRIAAGALLVYKNTSIGGTIQGIDPSREVAVTTMHKFVLPGGRFFKENDSDVIILGETLAKNLHVSVGDTLAIVSQDMRGSIAAGKFFVIGLVRTLNREYDRNLAFIPFDQAITTFDMSAGGDDGVAGGNTGTFINSIVLRVKDSDNCDAIIKTLKSAATNEIEIMGWEELIPETRQFVDLKKTSAWIFISILYLIMAFGVLNTIQMSVFERIREFGIMLAVGTAPSMIIRMVLFESCIITVTGIILGSAAGALLCYYFNIHPIDYSSISKEIQVWGITSTTFPAELKLWNIRNESLIILTLSMLFSIFPAYRASRLKPVESIRHL